MMLESSEGRALRAAAAAFTLAAAAAARAAPQTIRVPADQATIQGAIAAASDGDTVLVAPGTYHENLDFQGKAITLTSEAGPETTVVDGGAAGPVVVFHTGEGPRSVLNGFTLRNGRADFEGGGVGVSDASPTITGNWILDNVACQGTGIAVGFGGPLIQGNTVRGGVQTCSGGWGGGIQVRGRASPAAQVLDNVIEDNAASTGGGIALFAASGGVAVRGNVVRGNRALYEGGGIAMANTSDELVAGNVITGNTAGSEGGGIWWAAASGSTFRVLANTVAANGAPLAPALYATGRHAYVRVEDNVIVAGPGLPAISCSDGYDSALVLFRNNLTYADGGEVADRPCAIPAEAGNLTADPRFADAAGGDFRLSADSPAVDAGVAAEGLPSLDVAGQPRVTDGDGDCAAVVDLGAYELDFVPSATLTPASLDFGWQLPGAAPASRVLTVANGSDRTLGLCGVETTGAGYAAQAGCGTSLAAGATCTLSVSFTPAALGPQPGQVEVRLGGSGAPLRATVSATTVAALAVSPATASVETGRPLTFSATGGSGTGHRWSLACNGSGGSIDGATGAYVAGATAGVDDVVQVTDSAGFTASATVAITAPAVDPGHGGGGGCSTGAGTSLLGALAALLVRRRRAQG